MFITPYLRNIFLVAALSAQAAAHTDGLLAINNPAKNGETTQGFASAELFQANDNVAMREYGGQWGGAYRSVPGANLGVLFARAEVGVQWQGYRLFALQRGEAFILASRDTTDLVHQYQTSTGYDTGRNYRMDYSMRGFEADGLGISKAWKTSLSDRWQLRSGIGLSYLRGKRLKLETTTGQIVALDAKDLSAAVSSDSSNTALNTTNVSEFNAPFGLQSSFSGQGFSLDSGIVMHDTASGVRIDIGLADIAGQIDWKNVPNNLTNYNSASKYFDANGYAQFDPTATRTSTYRDLTQTLPLKAHFAVTYPWHLWEIEGSASHTQGNWFPALGVRYKIYPDWSLQAGYDLRFKTVGVGLEHQWIQVMLRTDHTNLNEAKAYGLTAIVSIPL